MIRDYILGSPRHFLLTILSLILSWIILSLVAWIISLNYMRNLVSSESGDFGITKRAVVDEALRMTSFASTAIAVIEVLLFLIGLLL